MIDYEERIKHLQELLDSRYGTPWWVYGDNEDILDEIARCKELLREDANV